MNTDTTRIIPVPSQPAGGALALDANGLAQLGLMPEDVPEVRKIADSIDSRNPQAVTEFGRDAGKTADTASDALLQQVSNRDLDEAGDKLGQVVATAQKLNLSALSNTRSRMPVIGPWLDRLRLTAGKVQGQFETAKEQIDRLLSEVAKTQQNLRERNDTMQAMYGMVQDEYRTLGLYIAAGKVRQEELRARADNLRNQAGTPAAAQEVADLDSTVTNLGIRVANLIALQQSALQTLPQIRVLQTTNDVLVDKFHTIRDVTVPAWKRQFALRLGINEQKNAVEFANTVDDMTNQLMRSNADLLKQTAVATAKANQRLAIDLDTLEQIQGRLIESIQEVIKINRDGAATRHATEQKILAMRADLKTRLIGQ